MTCEEYRKAIWIDPRTTTRAERAAFIAHSRRCKACHRELDRAVAQEKAKGAFLTPEEYAEVSVLRCQDSQDPEFRAVVEGQS